MRYLYIVLSSLLLFIAIIGIEVKACFDPMDVHSIEVLLNKPGIEYDIDKLANLDNVVKLSDDIYLYRSHLSRDVVVIVSLQSLHPGGEEKYIAIRVEPRVIEEKIEKLSCKLYLYIPNTSRESVVKALDRACELGWKYSVNPVIRDRYVRAVMVKNVDSNRIELSIAWIKNETRITIVPENKSSAVVKEVNELLVKAFNVKPVDDIPCMKLVEVKQKPVVGEEIIKNVLKYELRWLRDIGVVKGLSDRDIVKIMDSAVLGYAGWNSRLVYSSKEDSWIPYAEIEGATLIRKIGCSVSFNPEIIPEKAPEPYIEYTSTTTSYSTTSVTTSLTPLTTSIISNTTSTITTQEVQNTSDIGKGFDILPIVVILVLGMAMIIAIAMLSKTR